MRRCDVTPDGQHFIDTRDLPRNPPLPVTHMNVVLNWVEDLMAKAPATRT